MSIPTAAELTLMRTFPQRASSRIAVYRPPVLITARVSGTYAAGATSITLSSVVTNGTPAPNMTVWIGTTAGAHDKGKVRFRSLTGSVLVVSRNAKDTGMVQWANGDYITILQIVDPWAILPTKVIDEANNVVIVYEDENVTYTDELEAMHPLSRVGAPVVALWKGSPITVKFYAENWSPIGKSIVSHSWAFPGASPSTSSSQGTAGSPIEVLITTPGHYYFSYQCTDSNGKGHTRFIPVVVTAEGDGVYSNCVIDGEIAQDYDSGGFSFPVTVYTSAPESYFPEEGVVVFFTDEEYFGDTNQSIGGYHKYRENVVAVGYIVKGSILKNADVGSVTFQVQNVVEMMKQLTVWPVNIVDGAGAWEKIPSPTADKIAFYLLTEHSTIDLIADVYPCGDAKVIKFLNCGEDSLYKQLNDDNYSAVRTKIVGDFHGAIWAVQNQQLVPVASRTAPTPVELSLADLRGDITLGDDTYTTKTAQLDFIAFRYGGDSGRDPLSIYTLAPGNQAPYGGIEKIDGIRADDQAESNALGGLWAAWVNGRFKEVTLPLAGNWRIFDAAHQGVVKLPFTAIINNRVIDFSGYRYWVRHVSHQYDAKGEFLLTNITVEQETSGPPGITGKYPNSQVSPPNPTAKCPTGFYWDPVTKRCKQVPICPPGTYWDPVLQSCKNPLAPPAAPFNLVALALSQTEIQLNWLASKGATAYKLYRSLDGVTGWVLRATLASTVTSYLDSGLVTDTVYYYRVLATGTSGDGDYSNIAHARTLPEITPPPTVSVPVVQDVYALTWRWVYHLAAGNSITAAGNDIVWEALTTGLPSVAAFNSPWPLTVGSWVQTKLAVERRTGGRQYVLGTPYATSSGFSPTKLYTRTTGSWSLVLDVTTYSPTIGDRVFIDEVFVHSTIVDWVGVYVSAYASGHGSSHNSATRTIYFMYSTDAGATWSSKITIGSMSDGRESGMWYGDGQYKISYQKGTSVEAEGDTLIALIGPDGASATPTTSYFYVSRDRGLTWSLKHTFTIDNTLDRWQEVCAIDPYNQDIFLKSVSPSYQTDDPGERSTDGGVTWASFRGNLPSHPAGTYWGGFDGDFSYTFFKPRPTMLSSTSWRMLDWYGGPASSPSPKLTLWGTEDAGVTWTNLGYWLNNGTKSGVSGDALGSDGDIGLDLSGLANDPRSPNDIYLMSDGVFFGEYNSSTTPYSTGWRLLTAFSPSLEFLGKDGTYRYNSANYDKAVGSIGVNNVISLYAAAETPAITGGGVYTLYSNGEIYHITGMGSATPSMEFLNTLSGYTGTSKYAMVSDGGVIVIATNNPSTNKRSFLRSADGGLTWVVKDTTLISGGTNPVIDIDDTNPSIMWSGGVNSSSVVVGTYSTDGGVTWNDHSAMEDLLSVYAPATWVTPVVTNVHACAAHDGLHGYLLVGVRTKPIGGTYDRVYTHVFRMAIDGSVAGPLHVYLEGTTQAGDPIKFADTSPANSNKIWCVTNTNPPYYTYFDWALGTFAYAQQVPSAITLASELTGLFVTKLGTLLLAQGVTPPSAGTFHRLGVKGWGSASPGDSLTEAAHFSEGIAATEVLAVISNEQSGIYWYSANDGQTWASTVPLGMAADIIDSDNAS